MTEQDKIREIVVFLQKTMSESLENLTHQELALTSDLCVGYLEWYMEEITPDPETADDFDLDFETEMLFCLFYIQKEVTRRRKK